MVFAASAVELSEGLEFGKHLVSYEDVSRPLRLENLSQELHSGIFLMALRRQLIFLLMN